MSLLEQIKPEIDKHQVISFDIFDTLLLRPYVKPTDLFFHLERLENAKGFAKARIEAEKQARKTHSDLEDINIDEIYDEIADKYKGLKEKEMALEAEVLTANPEMKEVYDYAIKQKKKIVIISDMYLPDNFLHDVLTKNGYTNFRLYVSGDKRKKKGTGTIYQYVLKKLNIEPKSVIHIGDNKQTDYEVPQNLGISAYWYEQVLSRYLKQNEKAKIFLDKYKDNLEASVMIMSFALHWLTHQDEDFWSRIGYEYGGPMCYAYMRWVEQQVLEKGIKEILFVARDGYSLQKVFDSFGHKDIKTHYVYAPRQVYQNCNVLEAAENGNCLSALNYYKLKDKKIKEIASKVKTEKEASIFIKQNISLFNILERKEKKEYEQYINSLSISEKKIAIVDTITENFSSQRLLRYFLVNNEIEGFYWNVVQRSIKKYANIYMMNQWGEVSRHSGITCWDFVEYMMTSPEPPINRIENNQVIYKKRLSKEEVNREKRYEVISSLILDFTYNIAQFKLCRYEMIKEWINLLFAYPTVLEKEEFAAVKVAYDAAHEEYRSLINWSNKNKINEQYVDKLTFSVLGLPIYKVKQLGFYSFRYKEDMFKNKILLFGIPIIKEEKSSWFSSWSILGIKCLKYKNSVEKRSLHLFGFQVFKIKGKVPTKNIMTVEELANKVVTKKYLCETVVKHNRIMERKLSTFYLHQQTFPQFKGINRGKDVVIIATGPSLSQFKPIKNAVYIGVNRAVQYDKVHYDYYFVQDYSGATPTYIDEVYKYQNCIKFMGLTVEDTHPRRTIPELYGTGTNIYRYRTDWESLPHFETKFAYDLATTALGCGGTVVLPAIQFALWTHPKRIYLVGCDTTTSGYFDNRADKANFLNTEKLKGMYQEIKAFAHQYYPDVEIISINPVGLKGIFEDEYQ